MCPPASRTAPCRARKSSPQFLQKDACSLDPLRQQLLATHGAAKNAGQREPADELDRQGYHWVVRRSVEERPQHPVAFLARLAFGVKERRAQLRVGPRNS